MKVKICNVSNFKSCHKYIIMYVFVCGKPHLTQHRQKEIDLLFYGKHV